MNPKLKKFLIFAALSPLIVGTLLFLVLVELLLDEFISILFEFLLAKTSSVVLASSGSFAAGLAIFVAFYAVHKICSVFTKKITSSYQSFKNEHNNDHIFSEVYNDPTVGLKDKVLFFSIYLIYCAQFPFLYCSSKLLDLSQFFMDTRIIVGRTFIILINVIMLVPVALLELIKYPLIKLFTPLGLNVKQLSFLFNVSDVNNSSQSVHTSSFEDSVFQCAKELKEQYGVPSSVIDKEFEEYINSSDEFTDEQKERLKSYLNFNQSHRATWRDSRTGLTLTQAVNLVLTSIKVQKIDVDLLKSILLMRLKEGNGKCFPGMFNRIIYSISCLEAKNNFTVEVNSQIYEKMPEIIERFLKERCNYRKLKTLKDNFNDFYSENNIDPNIKNDIGKLIEDARQYVFNKLYVDYFNRYGQEVGRGPIKQKLKELITTDEVKEAVNYVVDNVEIPAPPLTCFEKIKIFFLKEPVTVSA